MSILPNKVLNKKYELTCSDPSRTKESFAAESDIKVIVSRFLKTGQLPVMPPPVFGDVSQVPRGTDALALVRNAQIAFESLPAELRSELGNDMARLEPWLKDPANREAARKFGLLKPVESPDDVAKKALDAEIARQRLKEAAAAKLKAEKPSPTPKE